MADKNEKLTMGFGLRIGLVLLAAVCFLGIAVYHLLTQNFHDQMAGYTVKLMQPMVDQGVSVVEHELQAGKKEASVLAEGFSPDPSGQTSTAKTVKFPRQTSTETEALRMTYTSPAGTIASDGRQRDIRDRRDIVAAMGGAAAIYGPYFNEEDEFVICYSAPVTKNGKTIGVLSLEKDGYYFSELIKEIKFAESGEAYIVDSEGNDIAVSNFDNMDWVTTPYNARRVLEEREDHDARSVAELEIRGLNGEAGVGTFYWTGSLCYVVYAPIPTAKWVMLAGVREDEIASMVKSTMFSSIQNSSVTLVFFAVFLGLIGLAVYWMIINMKRNEEINKNLEIMATHDALTGLLNRRFLETNLSERWQYPLKVSCQAAVFMMDIDDFKNYNDRFGHPQGDACLLRIAKVFKQVFKGYEGDVIRYGGEEFVAVIFAVDREHAEALGEQICRTAVQEGIPNGKGGSVTVSVGICHAEDTSKAPLAACIENADRALYRAKNGGKNRAELSEG